MRITCGARPDLLELELNPVRVAPGGVIAVDALATAGVGAQSEGNR